MHGRLGTRAESETRLPVLTLCSGAESTAVATARTKGIVGREGDEKTQSDGAAARSRFGAPPAPRAGGVAWPGTSVPRYVRTRHIGTGLRALSAGTSAMEFSLEEAVAQLANGGAQEGS